MEDRAPQGQANLSARHVNSLLAPIANRVRHG